MFVPKDIQAYTRKCSLEVHIKTMPPLQTTPLAAQNRSSLLLNQPFMKPLLKPKNIKCNLKPFIQNVGFIPFAAQNWPLFISKPPIYSQIIFWDASRNMLSQIHAPRPKP
jgi:hypothetical protein